MSESFSKYLIVRAISITKTATELNILNGMEKYFGFPKCSVTDQCIACTSKQFEDFRIENSIRHAKTAVRTSRANGQVEHANQIIH